MKVIENKDKINKAVFYIESPLQFLNAIEAINYFSIEDSEILIRLSNVKNDKQIETLLSFYGPNRYSLFKVGRHWNRIKDYLNAIALLYRLVSSRKERLFIGNYKSVIFKCITPFINVKNVCLLDDGTQTLALQKGFSDSKSVDLFTCFDLEPYENQYIHYNRYKYIRQIVDERWALEKNKIDILFVGGPLSEKKILAERDYLEIFHDMFTEKELRNMTYVPHRLESEGKLKKLERLGINIKRIEYPIELFPVFERVRIVKTYSLLSTALISLNVIYGMKSIAFKADFSKAPNKEAVDSIYKYYSSIGGIEIVYL